MILLALASLLLAGSASAQLNAQPYRQTFRAAVQTRHFINANPPMPMLYYKPGEWQVNVMPVYIDGQLGTELGGARATTNKLNGLGAGASYSRAFADKWGWYLWGIGNTMDGEFAFTNPAVNISGFSASFLTLSAGVVYQFFGEEDGGFTLPVFFGPLLAHADMKQTVRAPGVGNADFDMTLRETSPGAMIGVQAGINATKHFKLNPYLMGGTFGFTECHKYTATVRSDPQSYSNPSGQICSGQKIPYDSFVVGMGLNATYKPWNVTVNLTAPLLKNALMGGTSDIDVTMLSVSWAFGNFRK